MLAAINFFTGRIDAYAGDMDRMESTLRGFGSYAAMAGYGANLWTIVRCCPHCNEPVEVLGMRSR